MKPVAGLRCRPSHPVWLFPFQGGIQWQKQRTQHPQPPSRPHPSLSERLERPPTWWASISARRARKQWTIRCYVLSKTTFATPPCADKTTVKAGCVLFIKCLQIKCTFCLDETLPNGNNNIYDSWYDFNYANIKCCYMYCNFNWRLSFSKWCCSNWMYMSNDWFCYSSN